MADPGVGLKGLPLKSGAEAKLDAVRHFGAALVSQGLRNGALRMNFHDWHEYCFTHSKNKLPTGTAMSLDDVISNNTASSDFTLLEGLYQLAVTGHTNDWEFERLNNAVYERLLSSYGNLDRARLASANSQQLAD